MDARVSPLDRRLMASARWYSDNFRFLPNVIGGLGGCLGFAAIEFSVNCSASVDLERVNVPPVKPRGAKGPQADFRSDLAAGPDRKNPLAPRAYQAIRVPLGCGAGRILDQFERRNSRLASMKRSRGALSEAASLPARRARDRGRAR